MRHRAASQQATRRVRHAEQSCCVLETGRWEVQLAEGDQQAGTHVIREHAGTATEGGGRLTRHERRRRCCLLAVDNVSLFRRLGGGDDNAKRDTRRRSGNGTGL